MPRVRRSNGIRQFENQDLVLQVGSDVDPHVWDEGKYDAFVDELCGNRTYQKQAIFTALRFLLGGSYESTAALALDNFTTNDVLRERYGTRDGIIRQLQFPDKLSATLDLATGAGKSYVLYGLAMIMMAENACDRVLLICPSTTIESGLMDKFNELAGRSELRDLLPASAAISTPRVINASETITAGSVCIENYNAVLAHVRSSIRDSLGNGVGERTLILNDEAHHLVNASGTEAGKWKSFINDPNFGFRYVIGVSGTCYRDNEYFSDVIYRFSLREAMEQRFVKKVNYVAEMPQSRRPEEKWQLILNKHEEIRTKLKAHKLRPLTIVVTKDIRGCKEVTDILKQFLMETTGKTSDQIDQEVLSIYSNAPDLARLPLVDTAKSSVEWILSVSMLNEGWDVKRVFQIVPHEKRAFESKLLIAQVLGRGLRIPNGWSGEQPAVTVFNHDSWASDIRYLVNEIMELEKRVPTFSLDESPYGFDLLNVDYDPRPYTQTYPMTGKYKLFAKGYVDLPTEQEIEEVRVEFEEADTAARSEWKTRIRHATFTPREVAEVMFQRFEDLEDAADREHYMTEFSVDVLEGIVKKSLEKAHSDVITDSMRQKFLQSLGPLQRKAAEVVRYDFEVREYFDVPWQDRPQESASASDLKHYHTLFYSSRTATTMPDDVRPFFDEVIEEGSGYKTISIGNDFNFKSALNAVIANHDNERRFIRDLVNGDNAQHLTGWIKSTDMGFYEIDFFWKKGEHPKRGRFSPDFFLKVKDLILAVEIKDDDQISDPTVENQKKYEYAIPHFARINEHMAELGLPTRYQFNFLTPSGYSAFFQCVRDGNVDGFRSALDVELSA